FLVIGLIVLAGSLLKIIDQVPGFFGAGTSLLFAGLFFVSTRLSNSKGRVLGVSDTFGVWRLGFRCTVFHRGRSVLCIALIASSTFIIVAVDAFRHGAEVSTADKKSGTGGYPLLAES